jgi:hypothetical protein
MTKCVPSKRMLWQIRMGIVVLGITFAVNVFAFDVNPAFTYVPLFMGLAGLCLLGVTLNRTRGVWRYGAQMHLGFEADVIQEWRQLWRSVEGVSESAARSEAELAWVSIPEVPFVERKGVLTFNDLVGHGIEMPLPYETPHAVGSDAIGVSQSVFTDNAACNSMLSGIAKEIVASERGVVVTRHPDYSHITTSGERKGMLAAVSMAAPTVQVWTLFRFVGPSQASRLHVASFVSWWVQSRYPAKAAKDGEPTPAGNEGVVGEADARKVGVATGGHRPAKAPDEIEEARLTFKTYGPVPGWHRRAGLYRASLFMLWGLPVLGLVFVDAGTEYLPMMWGPAVLLLTWGWLAFWRYGRSRADVIKNSGLSELSPSWGDLADCVAVRRSRVINRHFGKPVQEIAPDEHPILKQIHDIRLAAAERRLTSSTMLQAVSE